METQTDNLGKVSVTVEKDFWSPNKSYDKLTIVLVEDKFATYISRKPVPTGMSLGNREFWIPFSSLKELIILDYSRISTKVDGLADVAYTGEYSDLKHTPDISNKTITLKRSDGSIIGEFTLNQASDKEIEINLPAAQILADWRLDDVTAADYIKNKPELHKVATSGKYEDLENKPEIGKGKLVITDGVHRNDTFNANSEEDLTVILSKVAFTNDFKDLDNRHKLTINNGDGTSTVYDGTEDKTINVSNPTNVHDGVLTIEDYYGNHKKTFSANQEENEKVVLSELAFTGRYNDIIDVPDSKITIKCNNVELGNFHLNDTTDTEINIVVPNALGDPVVQVQSDWNESNPNNPAYINNKPTIGNATIIVKQGNTEQRFKVNDTNDLELVIASANDGKLTIKDNAGHLAEFTADLRGDTIVNLEKVAFTGDYDDLTNKPDGMLVFLRNGQTVASFSAGSRTLTPVDLGNPGDTNKIETISVNGNRQTIDNNKNVDLAIGNAIVNVSLNGNLVKTFSLNQSGDPIDINLADAGEVNKLETVSVNGNLLPINNKNVDITIPPAGQDNVIEAITVNGLPTLIINKTVDITVPQASGEVNKIESISINGVTLQIDLTKNVDIPLKTLTIVDPNGQRYTYNATSDVTIQLPAGQSTAGFSYEVYSNRNLITNPQTNVLYLIGPESNDYSIHDRFEEWVYTTNLGWAKIGTTEIDLSQYYTRTLVDNLIGSGTLTINVGNNAPVTFSANEPTNSNKLVTIGDGVYEIYLNNLLKGTIQANAANLTPVQINLDGGGDANIIEQVQVNGQALTPDNNKAVNVLVPTIDKYSKDVFYSYRQSTLGIWTSDIFNQPNASTLFFAKFIGQDQYLTSYNNVNVLFCTWSTPRWTLPVYYRGSALSGRTFNTLIEYPDSSESKSLVFYYDINNPTYVSLVGVYDSEGSYSRTQIDNMLSNINSFGFEFYRNTQAISNPNSQTLYIIGPSGAGDDYYEEYVFSNGSLVKIGDVTKDLSIYAQIANLARVAFTGDFDDLINIPYDSLELTYGNNQVSLGIFDTNRHNTPQSINIPEPGNGSLIILDELLNIREQFYANQPGDHYLPLANVAFTGNVTDLHGYVAPGQVNNAPLTINHDGVSDIFTANASQPVVVNITSPEDGQLSINELDRSNNIVNTHLFTANQPTGNNVNVNLRSVAFTGDYNDLINTPPSVSTPLDGHLEINNVDNTNHTLQLYNFTADQLTGTVTQVNLRQVAFTADYNHLINRPNAVGVSPGNGLFVVTRTDNGGSTTNAANFTADEPTGNVVTLPLHEVAFTGNYNDLQGIPPAINAGNGLIDIISPQSNNTQSFTVNLPGPTLIYLPRETYTPTKTINGVLHAHNVDLPIGATVPDLTTIILSNVNPHDVETIWGESIFIGPQGNTQLTSANSVFYNGLVAEFRLTVGKIYSTSGVAQNGYNLVHWSYTQNAGSGGGNIDTISIDGLNITADANNNVNITRQLLLGCDIVEATSDPIPANYTNLVTLAPVLRPTILVKHDAKPHDYLTINGLPMYLDDNTPLTHQNTLFIDNGFDEFRITVYPDDPVTPHYYRIIHFSYYLDVYSMLNSGNSPSNEGGSSGGGTTGSGANNTSEEIDRRLRAAANSTLQTSNGTATSVLRLLDSSNSGTRFGRNVANSRTTANNNILSGIYSVSATNTVRFTKGNLIYNYTQDTWSLHTNLWDAFEDRNLTTPNYDLFNYGCNSIGIGSNAATKANVLNWSTNYNEHVLDSIRGNNGDWGRIYDDAYYRGHNSFRYYTLSSAEWLYLTSERPYNRKFALGTYNNRNLLILIPDGVTLDPVTLNNINGNLFTDNTFTLSDLQALTNAGYAILPQTGFRYGLYGSARYELDAISINSCTGGFNYLLSDNYTGNAPHPSALLYAPSTGLFVVSNYLVPTYGFAVRLVYGTPA